MAYKNQSWQIVSWKTKKKTTQTSRKKTREGQIVWWLDELKLFIWKIKKEKEDEITIIEKESGKEVVVPSNKVREWNDDDY